MGSGADRPHGFLRLPQTTHSTVAQHTGVQADSARSRSFGGIARTSKRLRVAQVSMHRPDARFLGTLATVHAVVEVR